MRLRWRLHTDWDPKKPRPNQLTPSRHHLCAQPRGACEAALAEADQHDFDDPMDRLTFLAERGHFDWMIWLLLTGRGWGKTRVGAEDIAQYMRENPGCRIALVGATLDDVRKTMVEGESGLLAVLHPSEVRSGTVDSGWNRTIVELWMENGAKCQGFSAEKPNRLRGPQHHRAWCDELAAWENMQDTWDNLMFGLRLGTLPQVIITTTPRPKKLLIDIRDRAATVITRGSMYENARNLAPAALAELKKKYEGTRLGSQELLGELIEEVEGALWSRGMIDVDRYPCSPVDQPNVVQDMLRYCSQVGVAVDPAVTNTPDSDETGIIVAGKTRPGQSCPVCKTPNARHALVFADKSGRFSNAVWANRTKSAYETHQADHVVGETNQGGDLVAQNVLLASPDIPFIGVHAKRGKQLRAQPVSMLYEQHKVHHIGTFYDLEDQQCTWDPEESDDSPDRLDALVYILTDLMIGLHTVGKVTQRTTALEGRR